MSTESEHAENMERERVIKTSALSDQLRDFDFDYLLHPGVSLSYVLVGPLLVLGAYGFNTELVVAETLTALGVAVIAIVLGRAASVRLSRSRIALTLAILLFAIAVSQVIARLVSPDLINEAFIRDLERGPTGQVFGAAIAAFTAHHFLVWLLVTVLVGGSVNYRRAKRLQESLLSDIRATSGLEGVPERELAAKQRESVREISRRIEAIESALSDHSGQREAELANAVRELRQEVVRPSLDQLNALVASARATPRISESVASRLATVPWRWQGNFFSGSVGALLIGITGLLLLSPTAYYFPGNFVQLPLLMFAFFMSVPAALLLFFAAALTPVLDPGTATAGGAAIIGIIVALALISFLQRFNRVRQVRAVESMSVLSAQVALDQVRRAQDLKVLEDRINSILHGSVQSTLLALELGLQEQDASVGKHSREALKQLKKAMESLDTPAPESAESFERALENILSVWTGSLQFSVDQSPEAADALHDDSLAASAVIEVVKEATLNAVKHSGTRNVRVVIGREGSVLRVRVSHPSSGQARLVNSRGIGMRYLAAITRNLRLVDDGATTTLYAEVPTQAKPSLVDSLG